MNKDTKFGFTVEPLTSEGMKTAGKVGLRLG